MKNKLTKEIYTVQEVANLFKVTKQAVYFWLKKKWIPAPGRDYKNDRIFSKEEVQKIIKWKKTIKRD